MFFSGGFGDFAAVLAILLSTTKLWDHIKSRPAWPGYEIDQPKPAKTRKPNLGLFNIYFAAGYHLWIILLALWQIAYVALL